MNKKIVVALIVAGALNTPGVARADIVTDWNKTMVDALYATHTGPQPSTRIAAIVQGSVFDAVNGIARRYEQFHPDVLNATAPHGASRRAAAASAAYTALSALLPAQQAAYDAQYTATLAACRRAKRLTEVSRGARRSPTRSSRGGAPTASRPCSRLTSSDRCPSGSQRRRHSQQRPSSGSSQR